MHKSEQKTVKQKTEQLPKGNALTTKGREQETTTFIAFQQSNYTVLSLHKGHWLLGLVLPLMTL